MPISRLSIKSRRSGWCFRAQKMPCLFVLVVLRFPNSRPKKDCICVELRGDEPHVGGKDVHCGKVEGALNIGHPIGADHVADIAVVVAHYGGLHLNAKTTLGMFDDEVVGGGLSPGFADVQPFFGGARHEAHFHPFAALLEGFEIQFWIWQDSVPLKHKERGYSRALEII